MASRGVNKVIIIGFLGNDPEMRYMPSGGAAVNMTVATSEKWKDKATGQNREETEWHRISAFNRLAEIMGEYLKKGSKVYIEGRLRTRKWQDKDGQDRYTTEIVANEMQMLDSRGGSDDQQTPQQQSQHQHSQQQAQGQQQGHTSPHGQQYNQGFVPAPNQPVNGFDDFEDDPIPF